MADEADIEAAVGRFDGDRINLIPGVRRGVVIDERTHHCRAAPLLQLIQLARSHPKRKPAHEVGYLLAFCPQGHRFYFIKRRANRWVIGSGEFGGLVLVLALSFWRSDFFRDRRGIRDFNGSWVGG